MFFHPSPAFPHYTFPSLDHFPDLRHAVLTRLAGVSPAPWDSLNLGWTVGDDHANVEANYQRWTRALGVERGHLTTTWQVHGNRIMRVGASDRGRSVGKADGLITNMPGVPLVQRYADCTPILLYDPVQHAAGIAHAGWQGVVARVAESAVRAMQAAFDSNPAELVTAVGPAIGPCCYEVGPEVVAAISTSQREPDHLFSPSPNGGGKAYLDLWEANAQQLRDAGVRQIEVAGLCTACHNDIFFSHRGDKGHSGRFAAFIMLEEG
jgi:YfiH family protein